MDQLERQLRDLGERVDRSFQDEQVQPRTDVHSRSRKRRSAAIVTSSLVTIGLVAVGAVGVRSLGVRSLGEESENPAGTGVLAAAADTTRGQRTALFDFEVQMHFVLGAWDDDISATGEGQMDFVNYRSYMIADVDESQAEDRKIEFIEDPHSIYTRDEGERKWTDLETKRPGGFAQTFNPSEYFDFLNDVSYSIEAFGEDEIDGITTTHYRAYFDSDRMAAEGFGSPEGFEEADFTLEPSEVWVDEAGLIRRITFGSSFVGQRDDEDFEFDYAMVLTFRDFGAPVDIELPDESEITAAKVGEDSRGSASASASESVELTEGESADSEATILLMTSHDLSGLTGEVHGSSMCVFRAPKWATGVDLMVDGRSRPVASFSEHDLEEPENGTPRVCQEVPDIKDEIRESDSLTFQVTGSSRTMEFRIVEIRHL